MRLILAWLVFDLDMPLAEDGKKLDRKAEGICTVGQGTVECVFQTCEAVTEGGCDGVVV